jgi:hypothetical protein
MSSQVTDREGKIYSAGIWMVKPGREEAFLGRWKEFALWTDEHQKGVISVVMVQDLDKPNAFLSIGPWRIRKVSGNGARPLLSGRHFAISGISVKKLNRIR